MCKLPGSVLFVFYCKQSANRKFRKLVTLVIYFNRKSLKKLFETINKPSTFFNRIVITVPVNKDLYTHLEANGIDQLRIVDTRGLGDQDDIERIIPFS